MSTSDKTSKDLRSVTARRAKTAASAAAIDVVWKRLIHQRRAENAKLRVIADEAGVTHQAIAYILKERS